MSTPFMAEIRVLSFNFAPKGWALCNGQLMPINQNQALFSLLGTTYGGDGRVNFALPDLRSRSPLHVGGGFNQGQAGGEENHTVNHPEMPQHTHQVTALTDAADQPTPGGNYWSNAGQNNFSPTANTTMNPAAIGTTGGGQAHNNMSPYLVLNFAIALQGIFPSPN